MLKLYNTFTKSLETLESNGSDIKIYLCGPTVQSSPHIGHGRSAVVFDFMVRYIKFSGNSVIFARNITDIDDKIIEKSVEENITYQELGERVTKEFKDSYDALNCLTPDFEPKATETIDQMIELIDDLIEKNYGYITKSGVYFDVSKYDSYLELSGRSFDEVLSGTRVNVEEDKKNPEDFALWKISKDNEPSWKSPWGNGRPGWHIECSAMIHDIFKGEIDIHCGGNDLIFPHHENERAQSTSAFNHKFVKHWVHNGMINFSGKKMSKSEGNSKFLQEYINNYGGNVLRYFFLRANYRKPQEFSEALLDESKATFKNIENLISGVEADLKDSNLETIFIESMNDDLNTPKFLGEMFEYINKNKNGDQTQITNMKSTIKFLFETLGFVFEDNKLTIDTKLLEDILTEQNIKIENDMNVSINKFVIKRNDHRKNKEFEIADYMRDRLEEVGICEEKKIFDEKNFENIISEKILILDHFQDTNNLGAVARSAAAFDFQTIFLPKKRSVQITEKTFAISSGGMEYINIVMYNSIFSLIKKIKNLGYWTIGLDMNSSNQIKDLDLKNQNIALIVGSEETGLSKEIQKKLDLIVDISMTNNMESLNASVATAIAMHEIFIKK